MAIVVGGRFRGALGNSCFVAIGEVEEEVEGLPPMKLRWGWEREGSSSHAFQVAFLSLLFFLTTDMNVLILEI